MRDARSVCDEWVYPLFIPDPADAMPLVTEWPDWLRKAFAWENLDVQG